MGGDGPRLAYFDADAARRAAFLELTRAIGLSCRALGALPPEARPASSRVSTVVYAGEVGRAVLADIRRCFPSARVIVRGLDASQRSAVLAFRAGADDFIWVGAGDSALAELLGEPPSAPAPRPDEEDHGLLVGTSPAMSSLRGFIRCLAPTRATVLITGETGTGKECAALLLHRLSNRARGPLVALNCAAIPEALLEGELFGYERGAFSGALTAYPGKLKLADGGTLLLDEISELSPVGQAKVLRAIESREAYRLGARAPTRFDVRIVAATNRDLREDMLAGRFRQDLFYRIAVAQLRLPPLRDRREDIAVLARHLLERLAEAAGRAGLRLDDGAIARLEAHDWPGNVRELRNAVEVAMVMAPGIRIRACDLRAGGAPGAPRPPDPADEPRRIREALERVGGNKSLAARALNCSRMTLYRKLARYGLQPPAAEPGVGVSQGLSPDLSQTL